MDSNAINHQVSQILAQLGAPIEKTTQTMAQIVVAAMGHMILPKFSEINERLANLDQKILNLEARVAVVDQQTLQLSNLESECRTLREKNLQLEEALQRVAEVALANKRHSYQFNLLLHGISEKHPDLKGATDARDPGFRRVVLAELAKFDPSISEADFEKAHRLGPPRPEIESLRVQPPRAILIRFHNRYRKEKLLEESIRRHKLRKTTPATAGTEREPYLTNHRVRDSFVASAPDQPMDSDGPPDPQPNRQNRRENLRPAQESTRKARAVHSLRQRKGNI